MITCWVTGGLDFPFGEIISVRNNYQGLGKGDRRIRNLRTRNDKNDDVGIQGEIRILGVSLEPHPELRRLGAGNRIRFEGDPHVPVPFFKPMLNVLRNFLRHVPQRDLFVILVVLFQEEFGAFLGQLVHVLERFLHELFSGKRICQCVDLRIYSACLKIFTL